MAFLLLSVALAFLVMRGADENTIMGQSAILWVRDSDGSVSSAHVVSTVESFAREHRVTVGREVPDLRDPGGRRHLYLAVGAPDSPAASWLEEGYPAFGREVRTEIHPFDEIGHTDPRGFYYVFGPRESVHDLRDDLSAIGLSGDVQSDLVLSDWFEFFGHGDLLDAFGVVVLCGIVTIGSGVLLGAGSYGVLRLQGQSFGRILTRDLRRLGRFWLLAFTCTAAGTVAFLSLYNGLSQFGTFLGVALFFLVTFTLVGLVTHAAALALAHRTEILEALKGRVPARPATISAYGARVPAMLLVFGIVGAALGSGQQIWEHRESRDAYAGIGDATHILLSGSVSERSTMEAEVGQWLRRADANGRFVLAAQEPADRFLPRGSDRVDFDVLVVNDSYLKHQPVLSPTGQRYGASREGNRIRVLTPEDLKSHKDALMKGVSEWVEFQTRDDPKTEVDIETLPTGAGQSMFTYGSQIYGSEERVFADDPVIVAVPNGSEILHDVSYFAYATQEAVVFNDPRDVLSAISDPPLSTYVNGMRPVAQGAAEEYRELVRDFRLQMFNLAAGIMVLLITGVSVCVIYSRKNAQTIFARHISGWTFTATHRSLLTGEALLALVFVGWATWDTVTGLDRTVTAGGRRTLPGETPTTGAEPLLALGIAGLSLVLIVAVLAVFHRRIVREGASEG